MSSVSPAPPPIPPQVLLFSVLGLAGGAAGEIVFGIGRGHPEAAHLFWLLLLVPIFLLARYRGWRGAVLVLGVGLGAMAVLELIASRPEGPFHWSLLPVALALLGGTLGAAWLAEAGSRAELLEWQEHILEGSRDAIFLSDENSRFRVVNRAATELTGYSRDELLSMRIPDLHEDVDLHAYRAYHRQLLSGMEAVTEADVLRKDGTKVPTEFNNRAIRVGGELFLHTVARDISERRTREKAARRLSTAVTHTAEAVIITDTDGVIEYVNPAFEGMTGYTQAEALGQTPAMLRSDRHDKGFYEGVWDTIRSGRVWSGRLVSRKKDGTIFHQDITVSPVQDDEGRTVNFVSLGRDVTELARLEETLRQSQKLEAVGRLTGGLAHDFNNFLTVVLSNVQVVKELTKDAGDEVRECLEDIEFTAREGADLVSRLLAFSRKESLRFEPVRLDEVVRRFHRSLGRLLPEHVEVRVVVEEEVPPVRADRAALKQILLNLVSNARDAMPDGGQITIRVGRAELGERDRARFNWITPGPHALLEISDTGSGMTPEARERVFEPFFTTKPVGKGTGLGMAMVYGLAKQHGGAATVQSELGQGTTFRVYLPATRKGIPAEGTSGSGRGQGDGSGGSRWDRAASAPSGGKARTTPRTILLAEDEDPLRRALTRILERLGHRVIPVSNGHEALAVLAGGSLRVDVLISDLVMPGMGGVELLGEVRARHPDLPVLLTSGYDSGALAEAAPELDVPLLRKPWTMEELARMLEQAIQA